MSTPATTSKSKGDSGVGFMFDTMRGRITRRHPRPEPSRRNRIARALECSEAIADKKLYGAHRLNVEAAKVISSDLSVQDYESVGRWMAPIDAALAGQVIAALPDAMFAYDCADAEEDLAQAAWLKDKSGETLEQYRVKLADEINAAQRLLGCIMLEQRKRREVSK